MWPEGNASDLQTVMALQNIKKADQLAVLEQYGLLHPNSGKEDPGGKNSILPNLSRASANAGSSSNNSSNTVDAVMNTGMAVGEKTVTMMASSMRNLTSTARNAVGDLSKAVSGRNT